MVKAIRNIMGDRDSQGHFKNGHSLGGRPRSGRSKAIELLDLICGNETNLEKLKEALQVEFDKDPIRFFKDFVMTTAPKEVDIGLVDVGYATLSPAEACKQMDVSTTGDIPN